MIRQLKTLPLALLLILFSSCTFKATDKQDFPTVKVPQAVMNKEIQIEDLPQFGNSHKNNSNLALHVINLSDQTIIFPADFGIQMFTKENGKWISVANIMLYPSGINTLPPTKTFPPGLIVAAGPSYSGILVAPVIIRVIIIGHYENNEKGLVGAYLDVPLIP